MIYLLVIILGWAVSATLWAVWSHRALSYAIEYARAKAALLEVDDPRGQAYNDMGTVLVMAMDADGRRHLDAEGPRWWERRCPGCDHEEHFGWCHCGCLDDRISK